MEAEARMETGHSLHHGFHFLLDTLFGRDHNVLLPQEETGVP